MISRQIQSPLTRRVGGILVALIGFSPFLLAIARADFATDLQNAARPINDGVPEVAIVRLQSL